MKRFIALLVAAILPLAIGGCQEDEAVNGPGTPDTQVDRPINGDGGMDTTPGTDAGTPGQQQPQPGEQKQPGQQQPEQQPPRNEADDGEQGGALKEVPAEKLPEQGKKKQ